MPLLSLVKAIALPSGEKRGCESYAGPLVIALAVPPAIREGVDVAQKIEGERLAVRRNVDGHPRAFVGLEGELARVGSRLVDVRGDVGSLLLRFVLGRVARQSGSGQRQGRKRQEAEQPVAHRILHRERAE